MDSEGIQIKIQNLAYAGKILENIRSLDDYSIPDGAHIHLLLRFGHG
jgi:hypothetical protein